MIKKVYALLGVSSEAIASWQVMGTSFGGQAIL